MVDWGAEGLINDHTLQFLHFSQCTEQWQGLLPLKMYKRSQILRFQFTKFWGFTEHKLTLHRAVSGQRG